MSFAWEKRWADYYKIMDIAEDASAQKIKEAFRKKVRVCHPDTVPEKNRQEASEEYIMVVEAYNCLNNTESKKAYDEKYNKMKEPDCFLTQDRWEIARAVPSAVYSTFIEIGNNGGPCHDFDIRYCPVSWLKIVDCYAVGEDTSNPFPVRVELQAIMQDWNKQYQEQIVIRVDGKKNLVFNIDIKTMYKPQASSVPCRR